MLGVAMPRRDDCGSRALLSPLARDARPCGETRLARCPAPSSGARGFIADPLAVERAADPLLGAAALAERRLRLAQPLTAALPDHRLAPMVMLAGRAFGQLASVCSRSVRLASPCLSMRLAPRCRSGRVPNGSRTIDRVGLCGTRCLAWHPLALLAQRQRCHEGRMDRARLS
jgi:hypothetical protein